MYVHDFTSKAHSPEYLPPISTHKPLASLRIPTQPYWKQLSHHTAVSARVLSSFYST